MFNANPVLGTEYTILNKTIRILHLQSLVTAGRTSYETVKSTYLIQSMMCVLGKEKSILKAKNDAHKSQSRHLPGGEELKGEISSQRTCEDILREKSLEQWRIWKAIMTGGQGTKEKATPLSLKEKQCPVGERDANQQKQ